METILTIQIKEVEQRFNNKVLKINNFEELNKDVWYDRQIIEKINSYKGDLKTRQNKYINLLTKHKNKEITEITQEYNNIIESQDFKNDLIITIEWKRSQMWGSNPRAYTNYGFEGSSIGGCGYCKTSTATAQALNSHLPILKLMYQKINKELQNPKKEYTEQNGFKEQGLNNILPHILGYGSGHGIKPHFQGGVGVCAHERIIENIGLKWENIISTKQVDVYRISKEL